MERPAVGIDDDGVKSQRWPIIQEGMLVGLQTNRETAHFVAAPGATEREQEVEPLTGYLVGRAKQGEPLKPMRLFHSSNLYLSLLFVAVAVLTAVTARRRPAARAPRSRGRGRA